MGSPTFGIPGTSNNAPQPIPGNTNPTGTNNGVGFGGANFPNYPVFGSPSTSPVSPSSNAPLFSGTSGGLANLSSGITLPIGNNPNDPLWQQLANSLGKAYGPGAGDMIYQLLTNGMFNPQVAASFLNAMQPGIQQGQASVLNSFGDEGSRFGSAAALGLGNYESQVNLNEQSTLAGLYENAQSQQLNLLENVLPTLHGEKANKGSWIDDLLGGLEVAGSIAAAPFSGGASLAGLGPGLSTLNQGITGGSSGGGMTAPLVQPYQVNPIMNTNSSSATGSNLPSWMQQQLNDQLLQESSAGGALGGTDPFSGAQTYTDALMF